MTKNSSWRFSGKAMAVSAVFAVMLVVSITAVAGKLFHDNSTAVISEVVKHSQHHHGGNAGETINVLDTNTVNEVIDEQTRIDTILLAYRRLPAAELGRLGVAIDKPIMAGSKEASDLFEAWTKRQAEIKAVMELVAKPVRIMEDIILKFQQAINASEVSLSTLEPALVELESLLSDVDNARDFHTIGGWPILLTLLSSSFSNEIRASAAWAIGTAIKNNYDYQLWTLEKHDLYAHFRVENKTSTIDLLLDIIESTTDSDVNDLHFQRKALYALTSAARGNPEVQLEVLKSSQTLPGTFLKIVNKFNFDVLTSKVVDVKNTNAPRVWGFILDLIEERRYVKSELLGNESSVKLPQHAVEELLSLRLLGDEFVKPIWINKVIESILILLHIELQVDDSYDFSAALHQLEDSNKDKARVAAISSNDDNEEDAATSNDGASCSRQNAPVLRLMDTLLSFVKSFLDQFNSIEIENLRELQSKLQIVRLHHRLEKFKSSFCSNEDVYEIIPKIDFIMNRLILELGDSN